MTSIPFRCPNFLPNLPLSPQRQQQQKIYSRISEETPTCFKSFSNTPPVTKFPGEKQKIKNISCTGKKNKKKNPHQENQEKKTSTRDCEDQRKKILKREQHRTNNSNNNRNKRAKVGGQPQNTAF
jgi:hypothetical protein